MKKIYVAYWFSHFVDEMGYKHNDEFDYSEEKRNEIINKALEKGISVMLRPVNNERGEGIIIWLDKGRFGQR